MQLSACSSTPADSIEEIPLFGASHPFAVLPRQGCFEGAAFSAGDMPQLRVPVARAVRAVPP